MGIMSLNLFQSNNSKKITPEDDLYPDYEYKKKIVVSWVFPWVKDEGYLYGFELRKYVDWRAIYFKDMNIAYSSPHGDYMTISEKQSWVEVLYPLIQKYRKNLENKEQKEKEERFAKELRLLGELKEKIKEVDNEKDNS